MPLPHEKGVSEVQKKLQSIFAERAKKNKVPGVALLWGPDEAALPPPGWKRVSFIRHGEGHHNLAQAQWHRAGKPGEPYTMDNDPEFRLMDPELTTLGQDQAVELRSRAANLEDVELIVVSPMRRAIQTALLGFHTAIAAGVPVIAQELCHEIAGKHTCDKRKSVSELTAEFSKVDFSSLADQEDPYWGDGNVREDLESIANRGADFVKWILRRPETCIVVATHSTWLLSLMNAVLEIVPEPRDEDPATSVANLQTWFATGEMRTVLLAPRSQKGRIPIQLLDEEDEEDFERHELKKRPAAQKKPAASSGKRPREGKSPGVSKRPAKKR